MILFFVCMFYLNTLQFHYIGKVFQLLKFRFFELLLPLYVAIFLSRFHTDICHSLIHATVFSNFFSSLHEPSTDINPCGGGVEYLHREPASRKRRRNGTKKGRAIA
jgi:hypothetical protein